MVRKSRDASEQGPDRSGGYAAILTFHCECEMLLDLTVCTGFVNFTVAVSLAFISPSVAENCRQYTEWVFFSDQYCLLLSVDSRIV